MYSEAVFSTALSRLGDLYGVLFILSMVAFTAFIALFFWVGWWRVNRIGDRSPFTQGEMAPGELLSYEAVHRVRSFLLSHEQPANPPFEPATVAVCRDTGRIFTDARDFFGVIRLGKDYRLKRFAGTWLEWEELRSGEKQRLLERHGSFRGYERDGLAADPLTGALMGWKRVPGTDLQVLIVQQPQELLLDPTAPNRYATSHG